MSNPAVRFVRALSVSALLIASTSATATFSIAACDTETRRCGVAVATHNLAVGNSVPFAVADLGAGVSQFETNPLHAPALLDALSAGASADDALALAMAKDSQFNDGADATQRQVAIVSVRGDAAAFTGEAASGFAGHKTYKALSVQGNGLAGPHVLDAMVQHFEAAKGPLAERLLTALEAGHAQGGQRIGVTSAALRVATEEGWPVDVDLRVDYAPETAISDLRVAYNNSLARTLLFRARHALRTDRKDRARGLVARATTLAPTWDRICLTAARLYVELGDQDAARTYYDKFKQLNPTWAELIQEELNAAGPE